MSRRSILALVAAVAVLAAALGWFAGQQIKSPADLAAEAEAPEPSLITVPVEYRSLSSNVVLRGQVEFSESTDLSVSGSADGVAIITRLTKVVGDELNEGDVAVEVAGRPVLVLQGELPVFRSLTPQLEGPDVRQLEESLVRLGFDPGAVDGVYDKRTEVAVVELYRRAGYTADEPTADQLERIESARSAVRSARNAVSDAETANRSEGVPRSTQLELDRAVTNAENALTQARADWEAVVAPLWQASELARQAVTTAEQALQAAVSPQERASAQAALDIAVSDRDDAVAAETLVRRELDPTVSNAETDLAVAKASRDEANSNASSSGGAEQLRQARESLTEQQQNLNRLEAEIGVTFPASELIFLPTLPSEVQNVRVEVGQIPQGPVMTVTGSGVRITSSVSAADRSILSVGAEAIMEDADLGISVPAVVTFVATDPGGQDTAADRYLVRLEPVGDLPEEAIDQNLRVTIPFASTDGEVLAVPMAALSAGANGSARVEVERSDGSVDVVEVTAGLNARALGLVEITPVDGELSDGDRVVVGRNQPTAGSRDDEQEDTESRDTESGNTESEGADG